MLHQSYDLVGFTDESWQSNIEGILKASMGVLLFDKQYHSVFLFSGPIIASSPYDAEHHAGLFLINAISSSKFSGARIIICTDSICLRETLSELISKF